MFMEIDMFMETVLASKCFIMSWDSQCLQSPTLLIGVFIWALWNITFAQQIRSSCGDIPPQGVPPIARFNKACQSINASLLAEFTLDASKEGPSRALGQCEQPWASCYLCHWKPLGHLRGYSCPFLPMPFKTSFQYTFEFCGSRFLSWVSKAGLQKLLRADRDGYTKSSNQIMAMLQIIRAGMQILLKLEGQTRTSHDRRCMSHIHTHTPPIHHAHILHTYTTHATHIHTYTIYTYISQSHRSYTHTTYTTIIYILK